LVPAQVDDAGLADFRGAAPPVGGVAEVGQLLEIEMLLIDGKRVVNDGALDVAALRSLPFILRLEPTKS
jgi:hypothetical protein